MSCKIIGIPRRKLCIGDLRHVVILHDRDIQPPGFGDVDFGETFVPLATPRAAIKTVNGKVRFDGVAADVALTHAVYIRFRDDVTSETWIELSDGRLLDIIDFEDLDERGEWLLLACAEKGDKDREANKI